jgi:type I restriction enzyme S subunit
MISGKMYRFRMPERHVNSRFMEYFLQTSDAQQAIDRMKTGGSDSGLNLTHDRFRQLLVRLAPLGEQRRIVQQIDNQFTRLDVAVASVGRARVNLTRYRAAIGEAACRGALVPTEAELAERECRTYEAADKLLERTLAARRSAWMSHRRAKTNFSKRRLPPNSVNFPYQEPINPRVDGAASLPEGWSWASLDSLLREPLRNGHSAKSVDTGGGIPTFSLSAVTYGDFSAANIKMTSADPEKAKDLWVEPGDILIERSNTPELVGTARMYPGPPRVAIFPDLIIRVRLLNTVLPRYVELVLQTQRIRNFFRSRAQGISGTMPKIDQSVVEEVLIPIPPLAEQEAIVCAAEGQISVVNHVETELQALRRKGDALRQSILRTAFDGKLVSQDLNDEPASVLLERIRAARETKTQEAKTKRRKAVTVA